jgi:uncharacterized membrane protein YphA (DoxX/SURF4 family)
MPINLQANYTTIIAAAIVSTLLASVGIWVPYTQFPFVPLLDALSFGSVIPSAILFAALIVCAIGFAFYAKRGVAAVLMLLLVTGVLLNLNCFRPDFYHYFIVLLLVAVAGADSKEFTTGVKLIHGATYMWAGILKLNSHFFDMNLPYFANAWHSTFNIAVPAYLLVVVPVAEMLIGFAFLTGIKLRVAFWASVVLHLLIMLQLIITHWNESMLPYNLFLIAGNYVLFYKAQRTDLVQQFIKTKTWNAVRIAGILFLIMPAFNIFNFWPHSMSCGMYSGRAKYMSLELNNTTAEQLPPSAKPFISNSAKGPYLDVMRWMENETYCMPNPQVFVYTKLQKQICPGCNTTMWLY